MREIFLHSLIGSGVLTVLFLSAAAQAFGQRRWIATLGYVGTGAVSFSLVALSSMLTVSTRGYRTLTPEEVAATVTTVPVGAHSFEAFVELPERRDTTYLVAGNQLLVDAHVLKWQPWANFLGLHTQYELDRLTGRYVTPEDDRTESRTVYSLKSHKPFDLFDLARRFALLALLVDTEYGSATFVDVERPAQFEVRASSSGLLVREVALSPGDTLR